MLELVGQKHKRNNMPRTIQTGIRFFQGVATPTNANLGDEWYNTETGKTFKFMTIYNVTQWYELPSFSSVTLTTWTDSTKPTNPSNNTIGYNINSNRLEFYGPGGWFAI